jgi:hypothetical protein
MMRAQVSMNEEIPCIMRKAEIYVQNATSSSPLTVLAYADHIFSTAFSWSLIWGSAVAVAVATRSKRACLWNSLQSLSAFHSTARTTPTCNPIFIMTMLLARYNN